MAVDSFVRKYRPASFDDYIGDTVKNQVLNRFKDRSRLPNTIMLYGTRGTGKTSMARLICKEILCLDPKEDGRSCGKCEMCEQINEYITSTEAGVECFGITEVDAATTTGKNDINDYINDAIIPPLDPLKHKVLILDECHMLSKAAQNSLLKVIEEPPEHLVFILCTTDPEQVLGTIHSRMQLKIEVRKKSVDDIADKLLEICKKENIVTSMEALKVIAKKGDRVPRECIMLLEAIATSYGNEVTLANVTSHIGDVSTEIYVEFFQAADSNSAEKILNFNQKLKEKDIEPKKFIAGLARFILDAINVRHGIATEDYSTEFADKTNKVFSTYNARMFDLALQVAEEAYSKITDDDTRNELVIILAAIKIRKIPTLDMLEAKIGSEQTLAILGSLSDLESQAKKENSGSISAYRDRHAEDEQKLIEKVSKVEVTKETLGNIFKQMHEVKGTVGLISDNSGIVPISTQNNDTTSSSSGDSKVIDKESLLKLLDD